MPCSEENVKRNGIGAFVARRRTENLQFELLQESLEFLSNGW